MNGRLNNLNLLRLQITTNTYKYLQILTNGKVRHIYELAVSIEKLLK